jgi:hypothetical protein
VADNQDRYGSRVRRTGGAMANDDPIGDRVARLQMIKEAAEVDGSPAR